MTKLGGWEAKFSKNFPQKIASAVGELGELVGASYEAVAYMGTQPVNGVNHAVLAQQTVLSGHDAVNAVVLVFNEKPGSMDVSLTDVRRLVETGGALGGTKVQVTLDIPAEAQQALDEALAGWVGVKVKPVAFLGSQVVKGTNFFLLAEVTPVTAEPTTDLAVLTVNTVEHSVHFERAFEPASGETKLGYWIVKGVKCPTIQLGAPLGEWP